MKKTLEIYVCDNCGLVYRVRHRESPEVNPKRSIAVKVGDSKLYIVVRIGLCDNCYLEEASNNAETVD